MLSMVNKEQSNNSNNETKIQYYQQHLCTSSFGECRYRPDNSCPLPESHYKKKVLVKICFATGGTMPTVL